MGKYEKYLIVIVIFGLLTRLLFFTGSDASDQLDYYRYANNVNKGTFELIPDHFSSRIGLIYTQAFIYRIFGVSDFTSNVFTLLLSIAGIVLIFYLGRLIFNERVGLIASSLLSFYPLDVIYASRLLPDLPSALFMALSVYLFLLGEKYISKAAILHLASGISLAIAYLMKEISIIMFLFFFVYVIYKRKFKFTYLLLVLGFLPGPLIEFIHAYINTGNPLFRYSAIEGQEVDFLKETYSNIYSSRSGIAERLFFHWPFMMLNDIRYGLFFPFAFIALIFSLVSRKKESYVVIIWLAVAFLYLNFGTLSLKNYVPIPVTVKFLTIITFPSLLLLAYFLGQKEDLIRKILAPAILILLLLSSIGFIFISDDRKLINELREADKYIKNIDKTIYTDGRSYNALNHLSGFKDGNLKEFNRYDYYVKGNRNTFVVDLKDKHDVYVLINKAMINGLPKLYRDIRFPEQINSIPQNWQVVKKIGQGDKKIVLYYVP